jgi:hypothetical protein
VVVGLWTDIIRGYLQDQREVGRSLSSVMIDLPDSEFGCSDERDISPEGGCEEERFFKQN